MLMEAQVEGVSDCFRASSDGSERTNLPAYDSWKKATIRRVEDTLHAQLPLANCVPERLHSAMRYAVLSGGKRVRALLCHAAGFLVDANLDVLAAAAAAIEMVHAYSLVHDDLPAMDNDVMRRGQATVHVKYDEATAILVGDALQSQAFLVLSGMALPERQRTAIFSELAVAIGSMGMAGGQVLDLTSTGSHLDQKSLEQMHRMKTGALIRAAVRIGALCGDNGPYPGERESLSSALDRYANAIGLAFQVVDDILDVTSNSVTLGKTAGKDAKADKATYISHLGVDGAQTVARQLHQDACMALGSMGERATYLKYIADSVIARVH